MDGMETKKIVNREPFDFSKIKVPLSSFAQNYGQRIRELVAQNQTREHRYAGIMTGFSHLGSKIGTSYQNSKKLHKLVRQAIALKNHLKTHMDHNNPDSQKLLRTFEKVIRFVTHYQKDIRDLPFDWIMERFLPSHLRGWKLSYPEAESRVLLMGTRPEIKDVPSDDDECETVNGSKTLEGPLKDPLCSRLGIFNLGTPSSLVALDLMRGEGMLYMVQCFTPTEESFPNQEEEKIWLEFKEFDKGTRESEVTNPELDDGERRSVEVDHPIVSVVGNFAVAAFNKACKKHVKKGEDNNLHGFEFMECKYLKVGEFYHFYLIIEAIEEGNPGTYLAEVTCNSFNGVKLLCKFFLTDYKPSGMKAMAVSYFYWLESICKTVDDLYKEKLTRLTEISNHVQVRERPNALSEIRRLKKLHAKLREGLLVKCRSARLRCPPDFNRMTKPDNWCDPGDHGCSGMVRRANGTSCSGYDYYTPI
ncbi:hypothetical protein CTI12_AA267910 [Artemisia annua]|uniref:Uncharacterized protein n=1 Tax=Artemisia annua TaxID=35608 RepID=A0A2U1NGY6_ARTAN|nr:hypothetical protein CTI12_AA267910 [Artemisia annua]